MSSSNQRHRIAPQRSLVESLYCLVIHTRIREELEGTDSEHLKRIETVLAEALGYVPGKSKTNQGAP